VVLHRVSCRVGWLWKLLLLVLLVGTLQLLQQSEVAPAMQGSVLLLLLLCCRMALFPNVASTACKTGKEITQDVICLLICFDGRCVQHGGRWYRSSPMPVVWVSSAQCSRKLHSWHRITWHFTQLSDIQTTITAYRSTLWLRRCTLTRSRQRSTGCSLGLQ
jgi:hypothetical protein